MYLPIFQDSRNKTVFILRRNSFDNEKITQVLGAKKVAKKIILF